MEIYTTPNHLRVVVCLVAVLLSASCARQPEKKQEQRKPRAVSVISAKVESVPLFKDSIGKAAATELVRIEPEVEGKLTAIHFEQGDSVDKGDLLYEIERDPYNADVKATQGELKQAKAQLRLAKIELRRSRGLLEDELISKQSIDNLEARVQELKGRVNKAVGELDAAKVNLERTQITAPVDGIAGFYRVNRGNVVSEDTVLTTIRKINPIYVDFSIPEKDFQQVKTADQNSNSGLDIQVLSMSNSSSTLHGKLISYSNAVRDDTGVVEMRALVENPDGLLWANQSVRVRLLLNTLENVVTLPDRAVKLGQKGHYVMVVKTPKQKESQESGDRKSKAPPTVEHRQVEIGQLQDDGRRVIASGLKGNERVVESGHIFLFDGMPVRIMSDDKKAKETNSNAKSEDRDGSVDSSQS